MAESPKILVVDDDPEQAQYVSLLLKRKANYETVTVNSGAEALVKAREIKPALILLDVQMPEMNGFQCCEKLKADDTTADIPIIFLTSRIESSYLVRGLDLGGDDYIGKPFEVSELLARVRVMLRIRNLQDQLVNQKRLQALVELAGAAAHELNQPLTVLKGNVELLRLALPSDPAVTRRYQNLQDAIQRMTEIIERMSKVRTYKTRAYVDDYDIIDLHAATEDDDLPPPPPDKDIAEESPAVPPAEDESA